MSIAPDVRPAGPQGSGAAAPPALSAAACAAFTAVPMLSLLAVVWLLTQHPLPLGGAVSWVPSLGIDVAWRIDGLSALMLLMITLVGSAVFVYTAGYMAGHPGQRRLYVLLTLFLLAMVGCVTADNLFVLFLFWEATSVLSFLLVGFEHQRAEARKSSQQALLVTGSGGLVMLVGFLLLSQQVGTSSISTLVELLHGTPPTPGLQAALVLILVGAFTKSAQFPFHFWLPNAMTAPTPVSAFLHSATMVKLGVYLLGRLDPAFGDWDIWVWTLKIAGSLTAAWGMLLALRERDLKRILAWSTVATLGTLVMLIGLRGEGATVAVGALLLAHALYKAPLFFVAGNVDHGTGTRLIDALGGLRRAMPWTATAAALAGLSMAGIPTSFGFVVKDAIAAAKMGSDATAFVQVSNVVFGAIAVAVAGVASVRVFWRHPGRNITPPNAHEGGLTLIVPPLVLALLGVALGLLPVAATELISEAASAMLPGTQTTTANFAVLLALDPASVIATLGVTLLAGLLIFIFWDPLHRLVHRPVSALMRVGFTAQYQRVLAAIPRVAAGATRRLQHGHLPGYVATVLLVAAVTVWTSLALGRHSLALPGLATASVGAAGAGLLIAAGALAACVLRHRLALLLAAGLVGYGSGLLFMFHGAPDVAWTQFTVETVFVIVIAAVLHAFKRSGRRLGLAEAMPRWRALGISLLFSAGVVVLTQATLAQPGDPALGAFFAQQSVPAAHGRNVVNVILVDFRAMDTLGESSVVLLALLAALPMLKALKAPVRTAPTPGQETPLVLAVVAPLMYGLILVAAAGVLLRGHNEPGGGFIAGLLAVTATVVWAFAQGPGPARARLPGGSALRTAAAGALLAVAAGVPGWIVHGEYLTHLWGPWGVSTVLVFDLGVFFTVWGAVSGFVLGLMEAQHTLPAGHAHAADGEGHA